MRLEYLVMLAAGLLLLLLLWPRGEGGAPVGPLLPPLAEIEIEGESLTKWSTGLSLAPALLGLAREVRPRIVLAWAALTEASYPAGSPELAAAVRRTRPRILVAWAALSTSILPRADSGLVGETLGVGPRILLNAAATTATPPLGGRPGLDAAASAVSPRIVLGGAGLSTLDLPLQTAPAELKNIPFVPRVLLNASDLGSPVELEGPPELPEVAP